MNLTPQENLSPQELRLAPESHYDVDSAQTSQLWLDVFAEN
jgi:hypothetical protein